MSQTTSRSHRDVVGVQVPAGSRILRENSNWRPSFRRLKLGLFTSKENQHHPGGKDLGEFNSSVPLPSHGANRPRIYEPVVSCLRDVHSTDSASVTYARLSDKESPTAAIRRLSKDPGESENSKVFTFSRRSSRSSKRKTTHVAHPSKEVKEQRSKSLLDERSEQLPRVSTAAYVPKHAAIDCCRIQVPENVGKRQSLYRQSFIQPSVRPTGDLESTDYQLFLATSRIAATTIGNSIDINLTTSKPSGTTDGSTTNRRASVFGGSSVSQRSRSNRMSVIGLGGLVDTLGEYIRPSRPGIASSQRARHSMLIGDDQSRTTNSVGEGKRSIISRPFMRPLSKYIINSDEAAERRRRRNTWMGENEGDIPAIASSAGIKRYSQAL